METRQQINPRVVRIFNQLAFKKKAEGIPLTEAKELVAKEFGYDSWRHVKDLEKKCPRPITPIDCENVYFDVRAELGRDSGVDGVRMRLFASSDSDDDSGVEIGYLQAHYWVESEDALPISLAFDEVSQDLSDFGAFFEFEYAENDEFDYVGKLALIDDIYIDSKYDEREFGKSLLKAFFKRFGQLVDAVFVHPVPQEKFGNQRRYDTSKQGAEEHSRIYTELGFKRVGSTRYYMVHNDYKNPLLDGFKSVISDEY